MLVGQLVLLDGFNPMETQSPSNPIHLRQSPWVPSMCGSPTKPWRCLRLDGIPLIAIGVLFHGRNEACLYFEALTWRMATARVLASFIFGPWFSPYSSTLSVKSIPCPVQWSSPHFQSCGAPSPWPQPIFFREMPWESHRWDTPSISRAGGFVAPGDFWSGKMVRKDEEFPRRFESFQWPPTRFLGRLFHMYNIYEYIYIYVYI